MKSLSVCALFLILAAVVSAQQNVPSVFLPQSQNTFLGGLISEKATDQEIGLTLKDAIARGLKYNLGLSLSAQQARAARGTRLEALSDLLPHLHGSVSDSVEQINIAAFGFPPSPQIPGIIGPFTVFDVRAYLTQTILDLNQIRKLNAETQNEKAEQFRYQDAREIVVLITANLYLETDTATSRVEAIQSQVKTAEAIYNQANDMKKAGLIPGIDLLRSQVELESRRQELIGAQVDLEKQKLTLARAIGLPLAQKFRLTDPIVYTPLPSMTLDEALQHAFTTRADYLSSQALVRAAEYAKSAISGKYIPSLSLQADYGDLGVTPTNSHGTFSVSAALRIPIWEGGKTQAENLKAEALLEQRKAEFEDLHAQIEQQVRTSFLDLNATGEQVEVAQRGLSLAQETLQQSQDRFAAGVANNVEVVQAQEDLARAHENYISALFANSMAKAFLARAMGGAEETAQKLLGGAQ
ncbi:MAG: TolC family protein [Acidobacteria bacterium]|nr:MAG: TolC family protein [Acidobacteriota bacterium]